MEKYDKYVELKRKLPVRYEADVAVIGGGIAGVSAACAAAKAGAKVILVERFAVTGGDCTTGGVGAFCGETKGQGAIFDEIIHSLELFGAVAPYRKYAPNTEGEARIFNHEILAIVLQEMLLKYNVKLLLHTRFVDAIVDDTGNITECVVCGKSGLEAIRAKIFIDSTGEGEVAREAGFETMKGDPATGYQLPMSLMFFVRHVEDDEARTEVPENWFKRIEKFEDLPMATVWPNGPHSNAIKLKIPAFDSTDTESMTEAEIFARRRMMEFIDYCQRTEELVLPDQCSYPKMLRRQHKWILDHCSAQVGIREGRRIVGEYLLTVDDIRKGRSFDDAIAKGVFYLDAHRPNDDKSTYMLKKDDMYVPPYHIPFRCLIVKDGKNLMSSGRCFSCDQLALTSARVTTTCSMMGQAAGLAAAMCVKNDCQIRDIDFIQVRKAVEANGADLSL